MAEGRRAAPVLDGSDTAQPIEGNELQPARDDVERLSARAAAR